MLFQWVCGVIRHWGVLVTGATISLGLFLLDQFGPATSPGDPPMPRWMFWGIVGCSLVVAFYLAWRDEHREALRLGHQLRAETPRLRGRVEWHRLGQLEDGTRVLLAALRIDNDGAETKVCNWRMITRPNTPEQNKPEISRPDVTVFTDDGQDVCCLMSQYLPFVLNEKPLGVHYRQGFVIFKVTTEPTAADEITYTFRDRTERLYSDVKRLISSGGEIKSFPPELTVHATPSTSRRVTSSQILAAQLSWDEARQSSPRP